MYRQSYSYKLLINGIEIPHNMISDFDISYNVVPELSICNIGLIDSKKELVYNPNRVSKSNLTRLIENAALKRGVRLEYMKPYFKDNDVVTLFIKVGNEWHWGFFGYVSSVSLGIGVAGEAPITLHAESSLKPFRYNYISFNSLLVPSELKEKDLEGLYTAYYSPFDGIDTHGKDIYEQVKFIFDNSRYRASEVVVGDGSFSDMTEIVIGSPEDMIGIFDSFKSITRIGSDADLEQYISSVIKSEGWGTETLYPQRQIYMIKIDTDKSKTWKTLTANVEFSAPSLSQPAINNKLDYLHQCVSNWTYIVYTLQNGDVVIEPLLFGTIAGYTVLDSKRVGSNSTYTFNGTSIATASMTTIDVISGIENTELTQVPKRTKLLPDEAIRLYGLRFTRPDVWRGKISPSIADIYNLYLLNRAWINAKTASVSAMYEGNDNYINRPVLVEPFDAVFLNKSMRLSWSGGTGVLANYNLDFGMVYDPEEKTYLPEYRIGDSRAISNLGFIFGIVDEIEKNKNLQSVGGREMNEMISSVLEETAT